MNIFVPAAPQIYQSLASSQESADGSYKADISIFFKGSAFDDLKAASAPAPAAEKVG